MLKSSKYHGQNHHVYYDISLINTTTAPVLAKLFENRAQPLLMCPSDYNMSVIRFIIPTAYIPIFVWPSTGNNLPNNLYYSVTIRNKQSGIDYRTYLIYAPLNNLTSADTEYLFVYSYQQFLDTINTALFTSYTNLFGAGGPNLPLSAPYMIFEPDTGICSIVCEDVYQTSQNYYEIYFNHPLYTFFDNFKSFRYGTGNVNGKDDMIYIENQGDNSFNGFIPPYGSGTYNGFKVKQEYNSLFNWNTCRSIVFVSNTVPVASENVNVQNSNSKNGSTYRRILTDFEPQIETGSSNNTLRSYLQYYPQGEYRLIDLHSDQPLYTFDIQIFFETSDQQLYELKINQGEYISMKILFRDKRIKSSL